MSISKVSFSKIFSDTTRGNPKLKTTEYLKKGRFPVIDQGKKFIAGYSNDETLLCKVDRPVIVFGDHTKIFKFVDFDFILGADGVKVLSISENVHPKFAYYLLQNFQFPEKKGYMRHFKYLKVGEFNLPGITSQENIAELLDKANLIQDLQEINTNLIPDLIRSIFLEIFGDVASNTKGWVQKTIGEVCDTQLGKAISKKAKLCNSPSKYLRNANVHWRFIDLQDLNEMDFEEKEKKKLRLRDGDVLVTEGGNVGRSAIWNHGETDIFFQNSLHRVRVNTDLILPEYFVEYMAIMDERGGLLRETTKVTIAHLTGTKLRRLKIPIPPIELQISFAEMLTNISEIFEINQELVNSLVESVNNEVFEWQA